MGVAAPHADAMGPCLHMLQCASGRMCACVCVYVFVCVCVCTASILTLLPYIGRVRCANIGVSAALVRRGRRLWALGVGPVFPCAERRASSNMATEDLGFDDMFDLAFPPGSEPEVKEEQGQEGGADGDENTEAAKVEPQSDDDGCDGGASAASKGQGDDHDSLTPTKTTGLHQCALCASSEGDVDLACEPGASATTPFRHYAGGRNRNSRICDHCDNVLRFHMPAPTADDSATSRSIPYALGLHQRDPASKQDFLNRLWGKGSGEIPIRRVVFQRAGCVQIMGPWLGRPSRGGLDPSLEAPELGTKNYVHSPSSSNLGSHTIIRPSAS